VKQIGQTYDKAAQAKRHRKYTWSRRDNGFSDMPLWRLVAQRCNLPLYQVLAFVNRLEEIANNAANHGLQRGSVEQFDADEFGLALGMASDEAARIFAALEDEKIGWISDRHISSFWDRNPDREEDAEDVRTRKRRSRTRKAIRELLVRLARQGKVTTEERLSIEVTLKGISDAELASLQDRLARAELSTARGDLSTTPPTSRMSQRDRIGAAAPMLGSERSQSDRCDIVTVTPEKRTVLEESKSSAVDNSADGARGETEGSPEGDPGEGSASARQARLWVDTEGARMLVEYLQIRPQLAETYIERWRRELDDEEALAAIIQAADKAGYIGARFHTIITDQWRRHVATARKGPELHLMPPRPGERKRSAS
jgi:hypothetical protein